MHDELDSWNDFDRDVFDRDIFDREIPDRDVRELRVRRLPSPGIAAVLAVLLPGLGHVYAGRLLAGAMWFLGVSFGYWAILVPGLLLHAISVWRAFRLTERVTERLAERVPDASRRASRRPYGTAF